MPRDATNPWLREMRERARQTGLEVGAVDVIVATEYGTVKCGRCGETAHMKPTIGTFKCPACGSIRLSASRNEWS